MNIYFARSYNICFKKLEASTLVLIGLYNFLSNQVNDIQKFKL